MVAINKPKNAAKNHKMCCSQCLCLPWNRKINICKLGRMRHLEQQHAPCRITIYSKSLCTFLMPEERKRVTLFSVSSHQWCQTAQRSPTRRRSSATALTSTKPASIKTGSTPSRSTPRRAERCKAHRQLSVLFNTLGEGMKKKTTKLTSSALTCLLKPESPQRGGVTSVNEGGKLLQER